MPLAIEIDPVRLRRRDPGRRRSPVGGRVLHVVQDELGSLAEHPAHIPMEVCQP